MKRGIGRRGLIAVGLALAVGLLAGPAANADPTCFSAGRGAGFCADGGPQGSGYGASFGGYAPGGVGFGGGVFGSPPGSCSSPVCGSRPTSEWGGFGWTGPGGTGGSAETQGQHLPFCTVCYQEYHVAGTGVGETSGRICYSATRTPPLYFC